MTKLVVKIGGSLWRSPQLAQWTSALRHYSGPLTIVPGGGPFADAVRAAQLSMRFSEEAAHEMALLAMEQYGLALADKLQDCASASTLKEIAALHAQRKIAIWRPRAMTLASGVEASWEVTSDSLAAFLAKVAGAPRLLLIKSVDLGNPSGPIVDARLAGFAEGLEVFVAGPTALAGADEMLARGMIPGLRFDVRASETAPAPPAPARRR